MTDNPRKSDEHRSPTRAGESGLAWVRFRWNLGALRVKTAPTDGAAVPPAREPGTIEAPQGGSESPIPRDDLPLLECWPRVSDQAISVVIENSPSAHSGWRPGAMKSRRRWTLDP